MIVEIHQQVLTSFGIDLEVDLELYGGWDEGEGKGPG